MTSPWNRIAFETGTCQSFFVCFHASLTPHTRLLEQLQEPQQKRSEKRDREDRAVARQLETAEDRVLEA